MSDGFALGEVIIDEAGQPYDFCFLVTNAAFERQTGLDRDILGRPITEALPDLEPEWVERYCGVALTGQPIAFEQFNRNTGRYYNVFCYSPVHKRFAILFQDVTHQKQIEAELRARDAYLRQMIASLPGLVWTAAGDGLVDYISPQWLAYTGTTLKSNLGRGAFNSLHPDDRPLVEARWQAAVDNGNPFTSDYRLRRHDGEYRWFQARRRTDSRRRRADHPLVWHLHRYRRPRHRRSCPAGQRATLPPASQFYAAVGLDGDPEGSVDYYNQRYQEFDGITQAAMPFGAGPRCCTPTTCSRPPKLSSAPWRPARFIKLNTGCACATAVTAGISVRRAGVRRAGPDREVVRYGHRHPRQQTSRASPTGLHRAARAQ